MCGLVIGISGAWRGESRAESTSSAYVWYWNEIEANPDWATRYPVCDACVLLRMSHLAWLEEHDA